MIENNLITTIYWSGTAQSTIAQSMNMNFDAAIHARKAISVILRVTIIKKPSSFLQISMDLLCNV